MFNVQAIFCVFIEFSSTSISSLPADSSFVFSIWLGNCISTLLRWRIFCSWHRQISDNLPEKLFKSVNIVAVYIFFFSPAENLFVLSTIQFGEMVFFLDCTLKWPHFDSGTYGIPLKTHTINCNGHFNADAATNYAKHDYSKRARHDFFWNLPTKLCVLNCVCMLFFLLLLFTNINSFSFFALPFFVARPTFRWHHFKPNQCSINRFTRNQTDD